MNNGDIVLGHNTLGKSAIFWDESAGTFGFYGDGDTTPEVVINTAGQVVAGDGDVVLDKTGLKFVAGSSYQETSSVIWKNGSGIEIMNINTREGSGSNFAQVAVRNVANSTSTLDMFCMAPANYEAKVTIATQNYLQGIGTQFDLVSDSLTPLLRIITSFGEQTCILSLVLLLVTTFLWAPILV